MSPFSASPAHHVRVRFPTFLIRYCLAFLRMRGREVTCLSALFPACSSCNQTIQHNFVGGLLHQQASTRTPVDPKFGCSNHCAAVTFGSMLGSLSRTFSDGRILENSLDIIFGSCEFLLLYPTTYQRLSTHLNVKWFRFVFPVNWW